MLNWQRGLDSVDGALHDLLDAWLGYMETRIEYEMARTRRPTPGNAVANLSSLRHATEVYREQRARLRVAHRDYKRVMRHFLEYKLD